MKTFTYNDIEFSIEPSGSRWDIRYHQADGKNGYVGTGLFEGVLENNVQEKATMLVKVVFPVGVRCVGPDVDHSIRVGDLKIVPPNVSHPNFIHWDKQSALDIG